jgi:hypothetical protein
VKSVVKDTFHGVTDTEQLAQDALTATLTHFDPSPGAIAAKTDIQLVLNSANLFRCEGADLQGAGTAGFAAMQCYDPSTGRILNRGSSPSDYQGVYNRVGQYVCDQYGNLYYQDEGYYQGGQYHSISK